MSKKQTCKNCAINYEITNDDLGFYEKLEVPPPTLCYDCRRQRRLAWRDDLSFYPRECGLCGKKIISIHAQNNGLNVYCNSCFNSDNWDPYAYGVDVDFTRPIMDQIIELQRSVPAPALINDNGIASVGCEYTQDVAFSKNCYMLFVSWRDENCLYTRYSANVKDCVDCDSAFGNDQLVYDSIMVLDCYQCRNVYFSTGLSDCAYCYDCKGCTDCFMCIGLRQKKYCFKNKEYSKDEYKKIVEEYKLNTWSGSQKAYNEFINFTALFPRRHANFTNCVECTGNDLINSKNAKNCFNITRVEDSVNFENGDTVKNCYDCTIGGECQYCYECITPDHGYMVRFCIESWKNSYIAYCENCHSSEYLFGCFSIRKGSYSIFNKKYTKDEYNELLPKVIEAMKREGTFGEFFPAERSYLGYNETLANDYYPLTKEQALAKSYRWQDELRKPMGQGTLAVKDLPDAIADVQDSMLNEVLTCELCERNYKIVSQELDLYRKMNIPIPRHCFNCRIARRIAFRNPSNLWNRQCDCRQEGHDHSGQCQNTFETSYSPDHPEKVYCEGCYNKEVL